MAYVKDLQEIEFGIILHASPSEVWEPAPHCKAANQQRLSTNGAIDRRGLNSREAATIH